MRALQLSPEIEDAIREAGDDMDPRALAHDLSNRFGKVVPVQAIVQVKGSLSRARNVSQAREKASNQLDRNNEITEEVKNVLLSLFRDETLTVKNRMEVSKELRQWLDVQNTMAGIEDKDTNTVFVVGAEWALEADERS